VTGLPPEALAWVEGATGSLVLSAWPLEGGTSSDVHAVRLGDGRTLVLRRLVKADWLALEPDLAAREADALRFLAGTGLPTPELVAADPRPEACDVPAVLMTLLPGRVRIDEPVDLAAMAAALHALWDVEPDGIPANRRYRPYHLGHDLRPPPSSSRPGLWERAIERFHTGPPAGGPVTFIHRDFHAGNVLWARGRLTGVLDWIECCIGPPGVDIGHARANFAGRLGLDVADAFLAAVGENCYDPWFDVACAVDFDSDLPPSASFQRLEDFLGRALAELS
jgi:aminoglycoside phosphotransferase (APT) family kinase protein